MTRRSKAIQAVVDAWEETGPNSELHYAWQKRLQQPSPDGWPALAKAVQELVHTEQDRQRAKAQRNTDNR